MTPFLLVCVVVVEGRQGLAWHQLLCQWLPGGRVGRSLLAEVKLSAGLELSAGVEVTASAIVPVCQVPRRLACGGDVTEEGTTPPPHTHTSLSLLLTSVSGLPPARAACVKLTRATDSNPVPLPPPHPPHSPLVMQQTVVACSNLAAVFPEDWCRSFDILGFEMLTVCFCQVHWLHRRIVFKTESPQGVRACVCERERIFF